MPPPAFTALPGVVTIVVLAGSLTGSSRRADRDAVRKDKVH
jgi:hypothetical protein